MTQLMNLAAQVKIVVNDDRYRQASRKLLTEVFLDEFHRYSCLKRELAMISCVDLNTDQIIGAAQIITPDQLLSNQKLALAYQQLSFLDKEYIKHTIITETLAILPKYRGNLLMQRLTAAIYEYAIHNHYYYIIGLCEPLLFDYYRKNGSIAIGRIYNIPYGGYYLPVAVNVFHFEHLKKVNLELFQLLDDKNDIPSLAKCEENTARIKAEKNPGFYSVEPEKIYHLKFPLFDKINLEELQRIFHRAIVIQCQKDDVIIKEADGAKYQTMILSGACRVVKNNKTIAHLHAGDEIGFIAKLLNIDRSASVIVDDANTKIIVFDKTIDEQCLLDKTKITLWRNIAATLARKLLMMNEEES